MTIGIYTITNTVTGKFYEGRAGDTGRRWATHRSRLNRNVHANQYLQRAWNKYGESAFRFSIRQVCSTDQLVPTEQAYLDMWKLVCPELLYNLSTVAEGAPVRHSQAAKEKRKAATKGKPKTPEQRVRMKEAALRRWQRNPMSDTQRKQISERMIGNKCYKGRLKKLTLNENTPLQKRVEDLE